MRQDNGRIILSGAGGLIGTMVKSRLEHEGWTVLPLSRTVSARGKILWDPMSGQIDRDSLDACDCAIHLAGASIAGGRWSPERKRLILESRVKGTHLLASTLAALPHPPKVMLCASGSNYYMDNRGGDAWTEDGPTGDGFLSEVCRQWEAAASPASEGGIRVVNARMGAVLSTRGGMLTRMLPAVCCGLGGVVGNGRQRISWIHEQDLCSAYIRILSDENINGPVNVTAPNPVSNQDFISELARFLHRPGFLPMPGRVVTWMFGEMGRELLLQDNAVYPEKLEKNGMQWAFPNIAAAFADLLGEKGCRSVRQSS